MTNKIKFTDLLNITDATIFKAHLANWNGDNHPLDVFVRSRDEWKLWNSWRRSGRRRDYSRRPPTPPYVRFRIRRFMMCS